MSDFAVRPSVVAMEEYAVESVAADIIVNANESNYPLPKKIAEKVTACVSQFPFNRYPPIKAENLCEVIAKELGVDTDGVKIGNGSSELLEKACYVFGGAGKKIAVPWPSFSMYGEYAALSDSEEVRYPLTEEGFVDPDMVISFCEQQRPSLLIICNPNNPTGNYNSLADMEKIIANVDCPVIMDEAYMEFADGKELKHSDLRPLNKLWLVAGSALSLVGHYNNLMVFRTFSKAYGLAGLRCGYAVGASGLIRQLGKALLPYHVNAFTLLTAKFVYENKKLYKEQIKTIRDERDKMVSAFKQLGFRVWPTATNFITFCAENTLMQQLAEAYTVKYGENLAPKVASGKMLFKYLLENGILVRDFTNHPVLQGCLRISIGLPDENAQIIDKVVKICAEVKS